MSILVTGATGGIGRALCQRLAANGARLILASRDSQKLEELTSKLPTANGSHAPLVVDMSSETSISAFATELSSLSVSLEGAVLMPPQPHAANDPMPDPAVFRTLFESSFIGPLSVLKAAISVMHPSPTQGKRCKIVIISGISSAQVLSNYATANVIRTAWVGEAKTLAFALGDKGIHVNTLSLGGTLSPWYREAINKRADASSMTFDERLANETDNVPLKKYATPEEVAAAVEGLLSSFSDHMTGLNILHDGGFTRAY
ncbi:SDR family NAD(P)-dependent oxidoreductase [Pararhizobium sp. PWRC1-1]|uniref:SDR family NAD(P)-dependent oxidoreductase n=1 Tax=Pararhizobium sp. PWRC1-1 TaxID=2804566 RepID=UPI003CED1996